MWKHWKKDIVTTIWMVVIISVVAVAVNFIRDPVLSAAADKGLISPGTQDRMRALWLIDDWSHEGNPGMTELPGEPGTNGDPENGNSTLPLPNEIVVYRIEVGDARRLFDEGECLFLDARTPEEFELDGRIPGAINWPADRYDEYRRQLIDTIPRDRPLVVYCSNISCTDSSFLASSLRNEGFTEIYWFATGMEEWIPFGHPVEYPPRQ